MLVFVTDRYRNKVNDEENDRDNCRYEFTYAVEQIGPRRMIPVVMEDRMRNAREWRGELGAALGGQLYVTLIDDEEEVFQQKCLDIAMSIMGVIKTTVIQDETGL